MKNFIITYLIKRFLLTLYFFFYDWYIGGFKWWMERIYHALAAVDRTVALKVMVRHWVQPLYQDYTVPGYVLGFVFRTGRIVLGLIAYAFVFIMGAATFLAWCFFLPFIFYKIIF